MSGISNVDVKLFTSVNIHAQIVILGWCCQFVSKKRSLLCLGFNIASEEFKLVGTITLWLSLQVESIQ
jgi:hypothetical protein